VQVPRQVVAAVGDPPRRVGGPSARGGGTSFPAAVSAVAVFPLLSHRCRHHSCVASPVAAAPAAAAAQCSFVRLFRRSRV